MMRTRAAWIAMAALWMSGCDCAGSGGGGMPCRSSTECSGGLMCIDSRCQVPSDAGSGLDGSVPPDTGARDAFFPPPIDAGPCTAISAESTVEAVPVDIIIAIDNSGSMSEEAAEVRMNINMFAEIIAASGLDYRVVLISRPDGSQGVCVPAPLGTGPPDCEGGADGRLLAIHQAVASTNAIDLVLRRYPDYRDFLRPDAAKVFIWITDDESSNFTADEARAALAALEPAGMFERTIHNAIVGYYGETPATWDDRGAGDCDSLADPGITYMRLMQCVDDSDMPIADCTPGRSGRVCETDWTSIFEEIARGVVEGVPIPCDFAIPEAPMGMTLDLDDIRLTYTDGAGTAHMLTRADSEAMCGAETWHFDDPAMPTRITLCPELCRAVQMDEGARLDIGLGCFPILM